MTTAFRCPRRLVGLVLTGAVLAMSGCTVADRFGDTMEMMAEMSPDPVETHRYSSDLPIDAVRAVALEVMEDRGYENLEVETGERRRSFQRRVKDGPHDVVTERVTQRRATLEATAEDGRLVRVRIREEHGWTRSTLEAVLSLLSGDDMKSVRQTGVRVTTGGGVETMVHPAENESVFEQMRERLKRRAAVDS